MTDENARAAATIRVGISNYVGTAALASLAGLVAIFTYYEQYYRPMILFYLAGGASVVAIIVGLILGGSGSAAVAKAVASGTYGATSRTTQFNLQSIITLIGFGLAVLVAVFGALSKHR